jgi:hypothetical protein
MMQDFKAFYKQHLVEESFKQDLAMMALATSLAITTGVGLHKIGFLKDKDSIDDALRNAQSKGYNVQQIIQQSKQPEIQQKAKEIIQQKQDDKAEQMHKKAVETPAQPAKPPAPRPNKELEEEFHRAAMNYIRDNELGGAGINYRKPYKDHKGYPTIGVGHLITSKEQRRGIFNKGISEKDVLKLFIKDIKSKLQTARRLFPKYDAYPLDLRIKLLDGIFRGDVSGSPGTIKLINAGKWERAANEFLDNKEYKEAVKKGYGTGPRMKKIADAIRSMANKQQPQSTKPKMQPETTPFF